LINIHTGFGIENKVIKDKRGFEKYKPFKNRPVYSLGTDGLDAINCKEPSAASFWNGSNFACLKYFSLDSERSMRLTNETDAITRNKFKDWSCNRHKTFKSDGTCANCPKNCDVCTEFGMCDICLPDFRLNDERTGCVKCTDDEVYDIISKQCRRKQKGSGKVSFKDWKDKVIVSK